MVMKQVISGAVDESFGISVAVKGTIDFSGRFVIPLRDRDPQEKRQRNAIQPWAGVATAGGCRRGGKFCGVHSANLAAVEGRSIFRIRPNRTGVASMTGCGIVTAIIVHHEQGSITRGETESIISHQEK
jgi:hypothetical protein